MKHRVLHAYLTEARYESLRMLRAPSFAVPFLLIPVMVYLLMGIVFFGAALRHDPKAAIGVFAGLTVFGMMGPGMFGFGVGVAMEREQGLLKLRRALPAPRAGYFSAKMCMAMLFNAIVMVTMIAAALWAAHLPLGPAQLASLAAINILGALPFCAIGLFVGVFVTGSAAPGFVNLVYLPMMWLSGLFIPLPKSLQSAAPVWPAYHLLQLSLRALGQPAAGSVPAHTAVLAALTFVLAAVAVRRLARVG
ncbi:MAG: ABC transporter permease [Bryobacteraceae bacterium]|jgi:ABC-2 type transport system permease protein